MGYFVRHRYGGHDIDPPLSALSALLDEVGEDPSDHEHVGVSVTHESEWCVAIYSGWTVTIEHLEHLEIEPHHLDAGQDRAYVLRLLRAAADGDLELLERQPWKPGYHSSNE